MEEWDGAKSRRFYGGRQHVQPIIRQKSDYIFVTETHQGIAAVYGRKHYPPKYSETQRSDRFCFKKADLPNIQTHKVRGLKKFDILPAGQKGIGGKLILHPPPVKEKEQKSSIRIIQPSGSQSEYSDFRKKIIVEDSRNGLPVLVAGDKPYGYPDYSIDFFKEPGLIPGSSNAEKKTNAKRGVGVSEFATLQSYAATIPQRKLWRERKAEERMNEEINIVKGLEEWEKNVILKS